MIWFAAISAFVAGAAVAAVVVYLLVERRTRGQQAQLATAAAIAEQRCGDLSRQLESERAGVQELRTQLSTAEKQQAALTAQLEAAKQNLAEQRKLLDDAHAQLKQAFASVSAEALAKNNEAFLQLAKERFMSLSKEADGSLEKRKAEIDALLKPMREVLNQYQERLKEIEGERNRTYRALNEQIGTLAETQRTLHQQTNQLVSALRRPQTRGQWGELTLRRLVELAGLSDKCDFSEQVSVDGQDGGLRPDMIIHLPGERQIIIDCKAPLDAFLDASSAIDEAARQQYLSRHAQQVRKRCGELAKKQYTRSFNSLDFVIMFLPGESFLYAAVEQDGNLIEDAIADGVIIATPTTLIALLQAVEFGWRQERLAENAEAIRKHGCDLYERLAIFGEHFGKVGKELDAAVRCYNDALGSFESRLLVTARTISDLGARTDKQLPDLAAIDRQPRELSAAVRSLE